MDEVTNENLMDEPTGSVDVSAAEGGEHTYDLNVIFGPQPKRDAGANRERRGCLAGRAGGG